MNYIKTFDNKYVNIDNLEALIIKQAGLTPADVNNYQVIGVGSVYYVLFGGTREECEDFREHLTGPKPELITKKSKKVKKDGDQQSVS